GDVDLAPDERLDADLLRLAVELDRAGEAAVIGERDGRHLELGRAGDERGDAARPVEDRVLGVDVEVNERRLRQGESSVALAQDRTIAARHRIAAWSSGRRPTSRSSST